MKILNNLKNPTYLVVAIGITAIFFSINYYLMSQLLGEVNLSCVKGGYLTPSNIVFAIILSALTGIMIVGLIALYEQRKASYAKHSVAGITGVSVLIGTFTMFCTACTIPVVSFFGLSFGLSFFSTYNVWFKLFSLGMLLIGFYFLEKQLRDECLICKI